MKFLVITLAPTLYKKDAYHSYAPYVKEMNLWFSKVANVTILSPTKHDKELLSAPFHRKDLRVVSIPSIDFGSLAKAIRSFALVPYISFKLFREMRKADHIHLRSPGNISLLACLVQIFFPKKTKTAKYAGNWDPQAKQPLSYRLQKKVLESRLLTKNMKVLVYGEWPHSSKNILPFFTASYREDKKEEPRVSSFEQPLRFMFVGSLSPGKHPLYAVQLVEGIKKAGISCALDVYGDGDERASLEDYVAKGELDFIKIHGNKDAQTIETAYKSSHFLLLPSKSEGWPKVVAEAMFWGVVPLVTKISCVPWMLNYGERGILLEMDINSDLRAILNNLDQKETLEKMARLGQEWSSHYTLDRFESEIQKLLQA